MFEAFQNKMFCYVYIWQNHAFQEYSNYNYTIMMKFYLLWPKTIQYIQFEQLITASVIVNANLSFVKRYCC